jgi:hypothetical protein
MAKPKKSPALQEQLLQNPVAKYMHRFNKAATHNDKKRYQRKPKHKGAEPFPMHVPPALEKAPAIRRAYAASGEFYAHPLRRSLCISQ